MSQPKYTTGNKVPADLSKDRSEIGTLSKADLKELFQSALLELQEGFSDPRWFSTKHAAKFLGVPEYTLRQMIKDKRLRIGEEVMDIREPGASLPSFRFHLQKCEKRLLTPPEKRSGKNAKG